MATEPSAVEQAVSRTLRDNLERIQRTSEELHQAVNDVVSACASSRPTNVLPSMIRAQTSAASLSATLEVLSRFVTSSLQPLQPVLQSTAEQETLSTAPAVAAEQPAVVEQPEPAIEQPEPTIEQPEPTIEQPEPAIEQSEPAVEQPEPAIEQPEPTVEQPEPAIEQPEPAVEQPEPAVEQPEPAAAHLMEQSLGSGPAPVDIPAPDLSGTETVPPTEIRPVEETPPADVLPPDAAPITGEPVPVFVHEAAPEAEPLTADEAPLDSAPPKTDSAFSLDSLPLDEQELHRRAYRIAKVSMQDIKLLRPEDVRLGRENKDLCFRLRDDIEKAHKEYDRRFQFLHFHEVDYFYEWMVEILADGNPEALGEYPYPSPILRR
jgi:hypothetical protein